MPTAASGRFFQANSLTYRLSWHLQIRFHQHLAKGLVLPQNSCDGDSLGRVEWCNATHINNSRLSHGSCYKYALVQGLYWQLCGDLSRPQSQAYKLHGTCSGHFDESQTLFGFGHMLALKSVLHYWWSYQTECNSYIMLPKGWAQTYWWHLGEDGGVGC